jgi:hypothetical protein
MRGVKVAYRAPFLNSVRTSLAIIFKVSKTPIPVEATAST